MVKGVSRWSNDVGTARASDIKYCREMAEANFTAIMGGFGAKTVPRVKAQLAAAERARLGVVASGAAGYAGYSSPAFWGYQIKDEPNAGDFGGLRTLSDTIAATPVNKGKLRYINLLPTCSPDQLCCGNATGCSGAKSCGSTFDYPSYVSSFVETVKPDVLCMDSYPSFTRAPNASQVPPPQPPPPPPPPPPPSPMLTLAPLLLTLVQQDPTHDLGWTKTPRLVYRVILAVLRKQALRSNINFWNYFGAMRVFGGQTDPTEAQVRWQIFTSLVYGASPGTQTQHTRSCKTPRLVS